MKKVNALALRQSFGKILQDLEKTGEPILLEKGREPKAVLITLEDYQERFVDRESTEQRKQLVKNILDFRRKKSRSKKSSLQILRALRGPLD